MTQQKSLTLKYYWSTKKQVNDGDCDLVCNRWSNAIYFGVFFFFLSSDEAALPLKQSELTETISSLLGNKSTLPEILCNTLTLTKTLCSAGRVHIKKGNSAFGRITSAPQLCFLNFFYLFLSLDIMFFLVAMGLKQYLFDHSVCGLKYLAVSVNYYMYYFS